MLDFLIFPSIFFVYCYFFISKLLLLIYRAIYTTTYIILYLTWKKKDLSQMVEAKQFVLIILQHALSNVLQHALSNV